MLTKWSYLLIVLATFVINFSGRNDVSTSISTSVSFGVKIGMLPTGGLYQFALIYYRNGKRASIQPITQDRLVKVGTGKWPIPGTRTFHDFFADQQMYVFPKDSQEVFDLQASIDSLWKIRFNEHPYSPNFDHGWSQGDYRPSLKQQAYIYDRYGVRGYDQEYFMDSSFFKLLKDVQDPAWIQQYRTMR